MCPSCFFWFVIYIDSLSIPQTAIERVNWKPRACLILTFFARSCHVVVCGWWFAGCCAGRLVLRWLAAVLALARLDLQERLERLLRLARPGWRVGGIHAAPHAAAKLQASHMPHHGRGVECLLAAGRKQNEKLRRGKCQRPECHMVMNDEEKGM